MKFAYKGYDRGGKPAEGVVDAPGAEAAKEQLTAKGLFVTRLNPAEAAAAAPITRTAAKGHRAHLRDLAMFLRQLAVLVSTGTPVADAVAVLSNQLPEGPWKQTVLDVRRRVEEGASLSEAMAAHPRCFDAVCRSLVAAGESRGKLGDMLTRLASLVRQQQKIRGELVGAMVYPVLLIGIAFVVLSVMVGFVMPRFEGLFQTLGATLPPTTQLLMATGHVVQGYWFAIIPGFIVAIAAGVYGLRSHAGARLIDTALVRAPLVGKVTRGFMTARLARILGVLVDGKVAMLDALTLTRQAAGNHLYVALVARAEEAVTRGEAVSAAFADARLVNPAVYEAIRSGERTGQLGPVLVSVADFLDEDNEVVLKSLMSIIEPVILVILGLIVGAVALSMFLPLFDLTAAGGPGGGHAAGGGAP